MSPATARHCVGLSVFVLLSGAASAKSLPIDRIGLVPTPIHEIQGSGLASPLEGQIVVTEGIVTARTVDGFFLQSATGTDDGDPATSQGLFVFTGAAPGSQATVGNHLRATGEVQEFIPAEHPHQMPVTRLAAMGLDVLATGQSLPDVTAPLPAELAPDSDIDALERYEGMRFAFSYDMTVVGAVEGRIDEVTGVATPTGVYHVARFANPRPIRKPGLPLLEAVEPPAGKTIPRNDGNPDRIRVDSTGQPGALFANSLHVGNRLTLLRGVLHYRDGAYTLLPDPTSGLGLGSSNIAAWVPRASDRQVSLGWMTFRRLFDDRDDASRDEPVMAPDAYAARIGKIAREICDAHGLPDILAIGHVENIEVLSDIAAAVQLHAPCAQAPAYLPVLTESGSADGLDLGFLVSIREATETRPRISLLGSETIAADASFTAPDGTVLPLFTQPPLMLRLVLAAHTGQQEALSVLAVQFTPVDGSSSSATGSLGWATVGDRVRATRATQAVFLGQWLDERQAADPAEMMAVVGGFESQPFNDGHVDVMGLLTGNPAPAAETWLAPTLSIARPLANLTLRAPALQRYTAVTDGVAHAPDHILVNAALEARLSLLNRHVRHGSVFAAAGANALSTDRDLLRVDLAPFAFTLADVGLTLGQVATIVERNRQADYRWRIVNQGGLGAPQVHMELRSNLAPGTYVVTRPNLDWTCTTHADGAGSRVSCSIPSLTAGANQSFSMAIFANTLPHGTQADFEVTVSGGYVDVNAGNDRLAFSTQFLYEPDVFLHPMTPQAVAYPGDVVAFRVRGGQANGNYTGSITIVSTIGARVAEVTPQPSYSYTCEPGVDLPDGSSRWTCHDPYGGNFEDIRYLVTPAVTDGGREITFHARVSSEIADSDLSNNEVSVVQPISNAGDIAVTAPEAGEYIPALDWSGLMSFDISTPTAGVSVNPRVMLIVNVLPADILGVTFTGSPQYGPVSWSCGAPLEHFGGRSRIYCAASGPLRHTTIPARTWRGGIRFRPTFVPGQAFTTTLGSAIATTDSEDRDPGNDSADLSAVVDQTTDQAVFATVPGNPVYEPREASIQFAISNEGRNAPRSSHMTFTVDAALEPGQFTITDELRTVNTSCVPAPAPEGHTSVRCAIAPNQEFQFARATTRPEWFGRDLTMTATVGNLLVDVDETNNTSAATVRVGASADLCVSFQSIACGGPFDYPVAIAQGGSARLPIVVANLGVSTAVGARLIVDVGLPPGRVALEFSGQACPAAVDIGAGISRVTCPLGDLRGDRAVNTAWLLVDGTSLVAPGTLAFSVRVASDRDDPTAANSERTVEVPVLPATDLRLNLYAKGDGHYGSPQKVVITAGAMGTRAVANVVEVIYEAESLVVPPTFQNDRWLCSLTVYSPRGGTYRCQPTVQLPPDQLTTIAMTLRPGFLQIGRPITVRARHVFEFGATMADPTPADARAEARIDIGGRSTQSKTTKTEPTPAYGVRRAITPTPLRPQVRATARE